MEYDIHSQPSYSLVEISLDPGEQLVTESGAMAWMTQNMRAETSARGGIMSGLSRSVLGGESFFQNTYEAQGGRGTIGLAPGQPGDIVAYEMQGGELMLERGAYLASTPDVSTNSDFQGLRGLFNEGMFILRATGTGTLFFNAYGDITEIEVDGPYVVDNGHAVAWEPTLDYRLTRAARIRSFLFSDQIIMEFSGRGKLWVQSRNPALPCELGTPLPQRQAIPGQQLAGPGVAPLVDDPVDRLVAAGGDDFYTVAVRVQYEETALAVVTFVRPVNLEASFPCGLQGRVEVIDLEGIVGRRHTNVRRFDDVDHRAVGRLEPCDVFVIHHARDDFQAKQVTVELERTHAVLHRDADVVNGFHFEISHSKPALESVATPDRCEFEHQSRARFLSF